MSDYQFNSAKMMCIHGRARGSCAECIEFYARCSHGQLKRVCRECELEAELSTLRQRAERAEARIAELEQAAKRQAAAALAGMDAVKLLDDFSPKTSPSKKARKRKEKG